LKQTAQVGRKTAKAVT